MKTLLFFKDPPHGTSDPAETKTGQGIWHSTMEELPTTTIAADKVLVP
jgi:hypothetical protein